MALLKNLADVYEALKEFFNSEDSDECKRKAEAAETVSGIIESLKSVALPSPEDWFVRECLDETITSSRRHGSVGEMYANQLLTVSRVVSLCQTDRAAYRHILIMDVGVSSCEGSR